MSNEKEQIREKPTESMGQRDGIQCSVIGQGWFVLGLKGLGIGQRINGAKEPGLRLFVAVLLLIFFLLLLLHVVHVAVAGGLGVGGHHLPGRQVGAVDGHLLLVFHLLFLLLHLVRVLLSFGQTLPGLASLSNDILVADVSALHLLPEIGEEVEVSRRRPLGLIGVAGGLEDPHLLLVSPLVSLGLFVEGFSRVGVHGVPFLGGFLGQIADLDGFALSFELVSQVREEVQISGSGAFGLSRLAFLSLSFATGILRTTHDRET